jgi:DEAD/DEAH box helicase domain-containing protein
MENPALSLEKLLESPEFAPHIVVNRLISAMDGVYAPFPGGLDGRLAGILRERGISRIYTHQAEVFEKVRAGRDVVVVTPTASGKTLCYNLPVLQTLLENTEARALYLFPQRPFRRISSPN